MKKGLDAMRALMTGEAAKICKVSRKMVVRWFDSGRLKGYRTPGSQQRRIPREYLVQFLKANGMPLSGLEDNGENRALIVSPDRAMVRGIHNELRTWAFKVADASNAFAAGFMAATFCPNCAVVDFSIGRLEAIKACRILYREFSGIVIVAVLPGSKCKVPGGLRIDESHAKPFESVLLADRVRELVKKHA